MKAKDVIAQLNLEPLAGEGGYFMRSYLSDETLPGGEGVSRPLASCIYYLITADSFSTFHRLDADEIFHFYLGGPCEQVLLFPDGTGEKRILGPDLARGQVVQSIVPKGAWQATKLLNPEDDGWALFATTVHPAFEEGGFVLGEKEALLAQYPDYREEFLDFFSEP